MLVVRGRAVPAAVPTSYRPIVEALASAVRTVGLPDAVELDTVRATLGRLIPEWRAESPTGADFETRDLALADAVVRFVRVVAGETGCLLILEDLHWADPETIAMVEYLADNLDRERVACVATIRDDDPSDALELARRLEARRATTIVPLVRLGPHAVAELVEACLDEEQPHPDVLALAAKADGVPFLVEELLATAALSGAIVRSPDGWRVPDASPRDRVVLPVSFADSVRRRLLTLGDHTRAVLRAAAVAGRSFEWNVLPEVTGREEATVLEALRAAVGAGLVETDDSGFRFRHALVARRRARRSCSRPSAPISRGGPSTRSSGSIQVFRSLGAISPPSWPSTPTSRPGR